MKIISASLLGFLLLIGISETANAESYHPKQISLDSATTTILQGGSFAPIRIVPMEYSVPDLLTYDIGVSREIKTKNLTQFQILSSTKVSYSEIARTDFVYNVEIPNPMDGSAEDTYRIYIKSYIPNDPESEQLVISKQLSIKKTTAKTVHLEGASLITSSNTVALNAGPVIYKEPTRPSHATSTALRLDFKSNTALELKGKMSFTKLRSNQFLYEADPVVINIQKDDTTSIIQLPVFEYVSGVYQGELTFEPVDGVSTPGSIEFTYIVDGPSATVGQLQFVEKDGGVYRFDMEVFGRAFDQFSEESVARPIDSEVYETRFDFLDSAGKIIFSETADVDYGTSTYSLYSKHRKIEKADKIHIQTLNNGSVIFDTVKHIDVPQTKSNTPLVLYVVILLIGIALYVYQRKVWILIVSIIIAVLGYAIQASAAPWVMWDHTHTLSQGVQIRQRLIFNNDYRTYSFNCNPEGTDILAKVETITSATVTQTYFGWADARYVVTPEDMTNAHSQAEANRVPLGAISTRSACTTGTCGTDPVFTNIYTMDWVLTRNVKGPIGIGPEIAVYTGSTRTTQTSSGQTSGHGIVNRYNPTTCDYCSNISLTQTPAPERTFDAQQFFYSTSSGKTHYSLSPRIPLTPEYCPVDMCTNLAGYQSEIPSGYAWNSSATDFYTKYSCAPIDLDQCTDISGTQTTPDFQAHGRDYFYSSDDNKLHFALAGGGTGDACTIDMCANTPAIESTIPTGQSWNLGSTDPYTRYSCGVSVPLSCSCNGTRTYSCTDGSTTPNAPQCSLTAACSYTVSGNQVTFTYVATNIIGLLENGQDNVQTIPTNQAGALSGTRTLGNTGDGQTAVASCEYAYDTTSTEVADPEILSFQVTPIVEKGGTCVFTWFTQDMTLCSLGGLNLGPNGTRGFAASTGENITKVLSCTSDEDIPRQFVQSKTCLVKPTIVEQ